MEKPEPGSIFLHDRNPDFHASPMVEAIVSYLNADHKEKARYIAADASLTPQQRSDMLESLGSPIPNKPGEKLTAYLGFLADKEYVNDGLLTGDQSSIDRQIAHHVIKPQDVPEAYFDLQRRILREQGHGDVEITPELRREAISVIQADQYKSLQTWAGYLTGDETIYPNWFRLYAFENVTKMAGFNKERQRFNKRSSGTTAPFPELSRGALSYVYDKLANKLKGLEDDDPKLAKLLQSASFPKLYLHALEAVNDGTISAEQKEVVAGSWRGFKQGTDPHGLHSSLQGYGLDWCTATGYETAAAQLKVGDFHVYYTRDHHGQAVVPRIAIRMQDGIVAEVRGINTSQELEPEMAGITSERLQSLPGGEEYILKAEDMKQLTALDKKIAANPAFVLTDREVRFLYEIDRSIKSFGYDADPRIAEIRSRRGEADYPLLGRLVREQLKEQLAPSYEAYAGIAEQINGMRRRSKRTDILDRLQLEQVATAKLAAWEQAGVFDYLTERLIRHGQRFTLVATPNIVTSADEVMSLATTFGEGQPYETYLYSELYKSYTPEQLSGQGHSSGEVVHLSLVPSEADPEFGYKPVADQQAILRELQAAKQSLKLHVPSVLDAITYWQTLRSRGDKLSDKDAYTRTLIRHFDLPAQDVGGWPRVPARSSTAAVGPLGLLERGRRGPRSGGGGVKICILHLFLFLFPLPVPKAVQY